MTEPDDERGTGPASIDQPRGVGGSTSVRSSGPDDAEPDVPDTVAMQRDALRPGTGTPSAEEPGPVAAQSVSARMMPVSVRPVSAPITVVRRTLGSTAALRASLAAKQDEANELRDSIDDLRRQLNIERSADLPERRQGTPRWLLALILACIVFAVLALLAFCMRPSTVTGNASGATSSATAGRAPSSGPTASGPITAPGQAGAGSAQATSPGSTAGGTVAVGPSPGAVRTTPMPWVGGTVLVPTGIATSGPGVDAPGSDATYALDADGKSVDAFERVRLATPAPQVTVQLPSLSGLTGELGAAELGVVGLQVELDGQPVTPQRSATGWTAVRPDGLPVTSAVLRYRLSAAVLKVEPARVGRLAALLTPLSAVQAAGQNGPVRVTVLGAGLISLSCPTAPTAQVLCGTVSPTSATATLPNGAAPVAQLQLDRG